jgi:hypothetical protein
METNNIIEINCDDEKCGSCQYYQEQEKVIIFEEPAVTVSRCKLFAEDIMYFVRERNQLLPMRLTSCCSIVSKANYHRDMAILDGEENSDCFDTNCNTCEHWHNLSQRCLKDSTFKPNP